MSKIYLEIFDKKGQKTFSLLSHFKKEGYLSGGTALALQLGHRKSFDFDVFVQKPIDNRFYLQVKSAFPKMQVLLHTEDQLSFHTQEHMGVTFPWYYFSPLYPFVQTLSLPLSDVRDIAADKAYTIGRRALWRDYADIYSILKGNILRLSTLIALCRKKFQEDFNESLFLEQLIYLKDLEVTPIAFIGNTPTKEEITSFLEKKVAKYLTKKLPR